MKARPLPWFLIASALLCLLVFRDALWGRSLLAPLDIAPALFSKYREAAPEAPTLPANHYIIDQLTYDLPIQFTIHQAYRRGEIPWWDPYTYGGRPLLADAHITGTDPVRVLVYLLLPFELAYNWTRILHFVLSGLGLFFLLRALGFRPWLCVLLGLSWQFAGCQARLFGHPWLQASFVYYPWLWLAWHAGWHGPARRHAALAGLLVAAAFYAGNLQSHAYVVLFAGAFILGYGGRSYAGWKRAILLTLLSGVIGALLASPVLGAELELFFKGVREVEPARRALAWFSGLASLSAIFPWALGTFKTLDAGQALSLSGLGFHLYIGSAAFVLAIFGGWQRTTVEHLAAPRRMALALVGLYFLILSSPLLGIFYTRCAGLGVLGLLLLAALGAEGLRRRLTPWPRMGRLILILTTLLLTAVNIGALIVYPRLKDRVTGIVLQRDKANPTLDASPALRVAQIERLPGELSFQNPEPVLAGLSLLGLGWLLLPSGHRRARLGLPALLALNLMPAVVFCGRFIPHQPVTLWQQIRAGGPEHHKVAPLLTDKPTRLFETAPGVNERLFPHALAHLFRVRIVQGYAALQPRSLSGLPPEEQQRYLPQLADYVYHSATRGLRAGLLTTNSTPGLARFQWLIPSSRTITVRDVSLGTIELTISAGDPATLLWTDTQFSGWTCRANNQSIPLEPTAPCFTRLSVPAGPQTLLLHYRPTYLTLGLVLAGVGAVSCLGLLRTGVGSAAGMRRLGDGRT
jgi:hypothetical protein